VSTLLIGLLICFIIGTAAALLLPRRSSAEARAFALTATVTAIILVAVHFVNRRAKR